MELDENSMQGHWAKDNNSGVEFFIIDDAVFSKLCILGSDVEPCFEGSSVTSEYSLDGDFTHTLYDMMNDLKFALKNKGGSNMPIDEGLEQLEQPETVEEVLEDVNPEDEIEVAEAEVEPEDAAEDATDDEESEESEESEFACGEKDKKKYAEDEEDKDEEEEEEEVEQEEDKKKPATDHSMSEAFAALKNEFEAVKAENEALKNELDSLRDFKLRCENEKKDALINQYHMLDDADKADVIEHKNEYSYEQIEEKLALIYVKKNVNFGTIDGAEEVAEPEIEDPALAFSLDNETGSFVPPIVELLRQQKNK
jgi:hypothetical protein